MRFEATKTGPLLFIVFLRDVNERTKLLQGNEWAHVSEAPFQLALAANIAATGRKREHGAGRRQSASNESRTFH